MTALDRKLAEETSPQDTDEVLTAEEESAASDSLLSSGQTKIGEHYRVLERLGVGGQGRTYLGEDERTKEQVTLKRLDLRASRDWKGYELFERECKVLQSLSDPAIPRYRGRFEHDNSLFLVLDYMPGESLQAWRERGNRMTESEATLLLHKVGGILETLHSQQPPVIHRDLKPANLIRQPGGGLALVDFGMVRHLKADRGSTVAGTFGYMAPEQLRGGAFPQTDIYGLAATIVALLTGREPSQLSQKGLRIDLEKELPSAPKLRAVLGLMLEPDPDLRPRSVSEALAKAQALVPRSAKRRTALLLVGGIVAATAVSLVPAGILWFRARPAPPTARLEEPQPQPASGYLTIVCSPFCDSVLANGIDLGPSPVVHHKLPVGTYHVALRRGNTSKMVQAELQADAVSSLRVSMAEATSESETQAGTQPLDRAAAIKALSNAASQASSCGGAGGARTTGRASVTFAPSGTVTSVDVTGITSPPAVIECVKKHFQAASLPPFSGGRVTIGKSFSLGSGDDIR